jgi:hypothetical protein
MRVACVVQNRMLQRVALENAPSRGGCMQLSEKGLCRAVKRGQEVQKAGAYFPLEMEADIFRHLGLAYRGTRPSACRSRAPS